MKNFDEEYYVFLKACENDFRVSLKSFYFVDKQEFGFHQLVYLRDAVISYGRPFSGNRGVHKKVLRLEGDLIPVEFREIHLYAISLRDTLFAHSDIQARKPELLVLGHEENEVLVNENERIYLTDVKSKLANFPRLLEEARKSIESRLKVSVKKL
jgi:hypothetical protein